MQAIEDSIMTVQAKEGTEEKEKPYQPQDPKMHRKQSLTASDEHKKCYSRKTFCQRINQNNWVDVLYMKH